MNINSVEDFSAFMKSNGDLLWSKARKAIDIPYDDEWMQENIWDELYEEELKESNERT